MIDVPGILRGHFHLARGDIESIGVEQLLIALVVLDQNVCGRDILQIVDHICANFGERREVFHLRRFQVHPEHVKILVALRVLLINEKSISFPKIISDIAVLFRCHALGVTASGRPNPDVHS